MSGPALVANVHRGQIAFSRSAAHELVRSLHVLSDVNAHPLHISWVLRTRGRLTPELRARIDSYGFWWRKRPLLLPDVWQQSGRTSIEAELAALRAAPIAAVAAPFLHAALLDRGLGPRVPLHAFLTDAALRARITHTVADEHPVSAEVIAQLAADPPGWRDDLAQLFECFWTRCRADDWPDDAVALDEDIARRERLLIDEGIPGLLASLPSPGVGAERGSDRSSPQALALGLASDADRVVLAPSLFAWPRMMTAVQRDITPSGETRTIRITYAADRARRESRSPTVDPSLATMLKAASDETRLRILRLLAVRARPTRELATVVGLTEAAISKHLQILHDAGWVEPQRLSYYVFYSLVSSAHKTLSELLDVALADHSAGGRSRL